MKSIDCKDLKQIDYVNYGRGTDDIEDYSLYRL